MTTVNITYRKNPLYSEHEAPEQPRLYARLDLSRYGVGTVVENLPIYYRQLPEPIGVFRVVYSIRVAGLPFESGNLQRLEGMIDDTLKALICFQQLPVCVFQVNGTAWPIYHMDNQLLTRYPGGPLFGAASIPQLRRYLADHFKKNGRITNRKELNLLYCSPYDLQLYASYCMLRTPDERIDDIPVFPTQNWEGVCLFAPINSDWLSVPLHPDQGILALQKIVGEYLVKEGHLDDTFDLNVRKLPLGEWERIKSSLSPFTHKLTYYRRVDGQLDRYYLDVFIGENACITARVNHLGRVTIYAAADIRSLQIRVGDDLYRHAAVNSPSDVQVVFTTRKSDKISLLDRGIRKSAFQGY